MFVEKKTTYFRYVVRYSKKQYVTAFCTEYLALIDLHAFTLPSCKRF